MASADSSTALMRRSSAQDVAAMPPPPFKRIKRPPKILDEDEYTTALSDIIARDYFPGLLESQAQHEYLAALESGNDSWVAEAAQKLREAALPTSSKGKRRTARNTRFDHPSATPLRGQPVADTPLGYTGSETPSVASVAASVDTAEPQPGVDTSSLSLSAFQAKYTSEDNESFNALLDKQNLKRRQKHAYLWTQDQRIPSTRLLEHRSREQQRLNTADDKSSSSSTSKELALHTGATDDRPAKLDSWTIKRPDNTFMFNASSVDEDGLQTVQEVREQNSKAGPKQVVYTNTRFPPVQYVDDPGPVPPSPSLNTDIVNSRRRLADTDSDAGAGGGGSEYNYAGGETPRVNGYAFVEEDEPENISSAADGPSYRDLLAGQVADPTPNPFKLSEIRKREDLHYRMVEKAARQKRDKDRQTRLRPGDRAGAPVDGGSNSKTSGNMTPAARRLMEKLGGRTPARGASGSTGSTTPVSKGMWTPLRTPRRSDLKR
ncbi:hypothetical protein PV08_01120 [Exophiala spinifera]|uniref:Protein DGCR14 n=1 Tax=Exophiala spinifera TaxID=91928 RepID=A0A0D2BPX3_9EURO|nr:uncharacterized protein PV08_01120 [Exophiala spinifera]KIW20545.1 hypothetical protein PV08_01120 [Exophiala spinifera]